MSIFKTIGQAIRDHLSNEPGLRDSLARHHGGTIAVSSLPDKCDDTPYCTVVNGEWVHTVGEYKDASAKHYGY